MTHLQHAQQFLLRRFFPAQLQQFPAELLGLGPCFAHAIIMCSTTRLLPPRRRRRLSFLRSLVFVLSSFDTFYQEQRALLNNSNSKTQKREKKMGDLSLFLYTKLCSTLVLYTTKRRGKEKEIGKERKACALRASSSSSFSLSLSLCVCAVSRVVLLYY